MRYSPALPHFSAFSAFLPLRLCVQRGRKNFTQRRRGRNAENAERASRRISRVGPCLFRTKSYSFCGVGEADRRSGGGDVLSSRAVWICLAAASHSSISFSPRA